MEKIIIYSNGAEILIAGNANNVDLLCEYARLITNNPFTKKILVAMLKMRNIAFMQYQFTTDDFIFVNGIALITLQNGDIKKYQLITSNLRWSH